MAAWIAAVKDVAYQLTDDEHKVADEDVILVLTKGLPPEYSPIITTLYSETSLTSDIVITRLLNEETRLAVGKTAEADATNTALAAMNAKKKRDLATVKCFNCGEMGHYANRCPSKTDETDDAKPAAKDTKAKEAAAVAISGFVDDNHAF